MDEHAGDRHLLSRDEHPLRRDRVESHTLAARVDGRHDRIVAAELARGEATVHPGRTLHGSSGNGTAGWRRSYAVAFRARATMDKERRSGFTHPRNDELDLMTRVGRES